jgi:hypothetical protein
MIRQMKARVASVPKTSWRSNAPTTRTALAIHKTASAMTASPSRHAERALRVGTRAIRNVASESTLPRGRGAPSRRRAGAKAVGRVERREVWRAASTVETPFAMKGTDRAVRISQRSLQSPSRMDRQT